MVKIGPLKLKAQVMWDDDVPAMGPGKADVLEAIDRTGSISAAARAMGMSYRRAWNLVDEMNRHFADPLVETAHGGPDNGARLTAAGRAVLSAFRRLETRLSEAAPTDSLALISAALKPSPGKAAKTG
jgi:molybdate transport system regulatory protein